MNGLSLVQMDNSHLDVVVEIEQLGFSNPWTRRDFEFVLKKENAYCRMILFEETVVGYLVGFFINKEFHLADFSIHPTYQRRRFGTQTLDILIQEIKEKSLVISLEVRMSNVAALELYKKFGFQTMAIRKDYYSNPQEDALVMLKPVNGKLSDWVTEALAVTS